MGHTSLLLAVAVILLGAKAVEALSKRIGMPPVLAEVLCGVVIGPGVLNWVQPNETISLLGSLGVILLLFIAGLETRVSELRAVGQAAMLTAIGGVVVPFGFGVLVGWLFGLEPLPGLFLGTILTATSVSISAETLRAMGRLKTRAGTTVMSAAIVDDIMGVTTLIAPIGLRMLLRRSHAAPPSSELAAATAEEALNAAGLPALAEPVR